MMYLLSNMLPIGNLDLEFLQCCQLSVWKCLILREVNFGNVDILAVQRFFVLGFNLIAFNWLIEICHFKINKIGYTVYSSPI